MDPETLRRLREQSGLRLDKQGRFWHRGGLIELAAFRASSDIVFDDVQPIKGADGFNTR